MTHHDQRIIDYLQKFPDVRGRYVAKIFGVEPFHVSRLRKVSGAHNPRIAAARARRVTPKELDEMIVKAVFKRGLLDTVLDP